MTPLPASLTIADLGQAGAELRAVEALLAGAGTDAGPVVVDAATLLNFDSSAIALLLEAHRQARATGRGFAVHGAPTPMVELATLYGVADLLGLAPADGTAPQAAAR